jgi:flavin reductase (DIM6/NTAB) family NADH-FMN oxidoreductase RutF
MKEFTEIKPNELTENIFKMINEEWFLVTANTDPVNPMTASWGTMGILWHKPVAMTVIRPQRFTHQLMEKSSHFTLSFFSGKQKDDLSYCGSHSGKDEKKLDHISLTPMKTKDGLWAYEEATHIFQCKKSAVQQLDPSGFLDDSIMSTYTSNDYHTMYIGEIISLLKS